MSLSGLYTWFSQEVKWALFIILLILLIVTAFKRAWIAMVGVLVGMAFIGMFIVKPDLIITLAQWLTGKLGMGFVHTATILFF
ncbi:hypothetical protein [Pseudobacillus badius]|uniref:hypothetical protein n=1 Tax=Bacillus badius TaxID=1455 RepID=UPI001CBBE639|nr:hypothetical protein [Bacillus badius]UAT32458.1 hypothetical protein K7T73_09725 [Bacillus badius]GLY12703.1 hypothetical protein Bbad01_39190 [Bacillus badius]